MSSLSTLPNFLQLTCQKNSKAFVCRKKSQISREKYVWWIRYLWILKKYLINCKHITSLVVLILRIKRKDKSSILLKVYTKKDNVLTKVHPISLTVTKKDKIRVARWYTLYRVARWCKLLLQSSNYLTLCLRTVLYWIVKTHTICN